MAKKKTQSQTPAAKRARDRRAAAKTGQGSGDKPDVRTTKPGVNAAGVDGGPGESEDQADKSARAANEIARRRHEPGAPDPENDGPDVGKVDLRPDTSIETQGIPRPARPRVPGNATAEPLARPELREGEVDDGSLPSIARFAKVRALRMGYFDNERKRAGDVFYIHNAAEFSDGEKGGWMEYAGSSDPVKVTTGNQELRRQHAKIVAEKAKAATGTGDANVLEA